MWGKVAIGFIIFLIIGAVDSCVRSCSDSDEETVESPFDKLPYTGNYFEMCIAAVNVQDFAGAHIIMDRTYTNYLAKIDDTRKSANGYADVFWTVANHVYKAEMLYLLPQNDMEANNRLIYTLQSMNIPGKCPKPGEKFRSDEFSRDTAHQYVDFVEKYNSLCNEMLELAISYKNQDFASRVLRLFKPNYQLKELKDEKCTYEEVSTTINKAQKRYKEAVSAGEFK